jgi:hypothetical protein
MGFKNVEVSDGYCKSSSLTGRGVGFSTVGGADHSTNR